MEGYRRRWFYPNGYGASVIRNDYSMGNAYGEGLYELAVIEGVEDNWSITYDTHITDEVIGYLTPREVVYILRQIKSLEEK